MTTVLTFDTSTRVGWFVGTSPSEPPIRFATFKLPKTYDPDDYGKRAYPLFRQVHHLIEAYQPDVIGFESPFIPMKPKKKRYATTGGDKLGDDFTTTQHVLRLQIALATAIEIAVEQNNDFSDRKRIRCVEVATSSAKLALAGSARLEDKKLDMVRAAWARGWEVSDDHQADAGGVFLVVCDALGIE
jgi:hypothetical protein